MEPKMNFNLVLLLDYVRKEEEKERKSVKCCEKGLELEQLTQH